ncbi:MAG: hypothetical protein MIO92_09320 [Methanosarcinaceae archaeon]|nr:hypothetical protein [Methanosarcinaceae archaeon]
MIETRDLSKPGQEVLKGGSKIPNKDKKSWIPNDTYIWNGIAALTELSEAGYDLAKFDDDKLREVFWNLYDFDKHAHWTYVKVMRRYWSKNKAQSKPK